MTTNSIRRILVGTSFAALALASTAVQAQDQAAADGASAVSEDIIVTARRKDERLQDVPTTINAVTADTIEKLNLREFKDIQAVVPGLQLSSGSNGFSTSATVRGVKFDVETAGLPAVEFYLNDAPMESNILFAAMYDIGQVEILRGPQGTLRGRASPSGSITITSRKPNLDEVGAYVNGTVNSNSGKNVHGAVNVPIINDVLAVRVAGYYDRNDANRVYSLNSTANPFARTESYRASVRFEPTDTITANFTYQSTDRTQRAFNQVASGSYFDRSLPEGPRYIDPFQRQAITDGYRSSSQKFDVLTWNLDWRIGGQKLAYVGGRSVQHIRGVSQYDQANVLTDLTPRNINDVSGRPPVCGENQAAFGFPVTRADFFQCTNIRQTQDTHELRLFSEERLFGMFNYVIGGLISHVSQYNLINGESATGTLANATIGAQNATVRPGRRNEHSVFGNLTAYIGDSTEISGGLRYINYEESSSTTAFISPTFGLPIQSVNNKNEKLIYSASVKHNFTDDIMAYGSVGSSWRPGLNLIGNNSVQQSALEKSFINLAPETSTSYELGLKTSWLNRRLTVNVSAFHQDFTNYGYRGSPVWFRNYPRPNQPQASTFNFGAAVPVKVDGVEVETNFQVTRRWSLGANFSYANGRIKNGLIPCTDLDGNGIPDANPTNVQQGDLPATNVSGCRFSGPANSAPKWNAVLQSEYSAPVTDEVDAYIRGLFNLYPSYTQDPTYSFDNVKNYSQLNLYTGIRSPNGAWEVSLYGKNLLNTQRVLSATNGPVTTGFAGVNGAPGVTYTSDYLEITTTPPREFGLNLRFAFGSR